MPVTLTAAAIRAARQQFADNALDCIHAVETGALGVNDPARFYAWKAQAYADALAGRNDHTFALQQRAHYIQTGECPALLP